MQPDFRPELLTTCDEKVSLLAGTGIDYCIMLDFTLDLACLSAKQFMAILKQDYRVQVLMIGYDHRFGHNRSEGFEDYVRYGQELGIEVLLAQAYYTDAMTVSSFSYPPPFAARETFRRRQTVWVINFFWTVRL